MNHVERAPIEFRGRHYLGKWRESIDIVRRAAPGPSARPWRTRLAVLAPLRSPVFILGSPRSGTTYLGEVLGALPSATYLFEPPIFKYRARAIHSGTIPFWRQWALYHGGLRILMLAAPGSGARVVEKNPNHTMIADQLLRLFPDAKLVLIIRDGRDAALSLSKKPWHRSDSIGTGRREPGGYAYGPVAHFYIEPERREEFETTTDLHRAAWIWRVHTEELQRLRRQLPPGSTVTVRYEDLLQDSEATFDHLLSEIGETSASARDAVLAASKAGHRRSIGRAREMLDQSELAQIERECAPLLAELGYD